MKKCGWCINFVHCYGFSRGHDRVPEYIINDFNAIRTRDLCVNNDKDMFIDRRKSADRRTGEERRKQHSN